MNGLASGVMEKPTAVSVMTEDEFADCTDQMRLLVSEEAYLWEFPAGSRDLMGDGEWLEHGPWRREDCSAAVHVWFDAGLVSLLRRWPEDHLLATLDARAVLAVRESWAMTPDGTNCAVAATAAGEALAWDGWRSLLSALRNG